MQLILERYDCTASRTIGKLYMDGRFFCWTLEDPVSVTKIPGETAIPSGNYQVVVNYSPRFKRPLPLLQGVPGFGGIRIHVGNTVRDTEGCILVGDKRDIDEIWQSRQALDRLLATISMPCWIAITEKPREQIKEEDDQETKTEAGGGSA